MSKPDTAHLHFREARYLVLDDPIIEYVDHQILFLFFTPNSSPVLWIDVLWLHKRRRAIQF